MGAKGSCTLRNKQEMQIPLPLSAGENSALFPKERGTRVQAEIQILASLPGVETGLAMVPWCPGNHPNAWRGAAGQSRVVQRPDLGGGDKAVGGVETLLLCPSPLP